jgi:hypothetical protein
VQSRGQATVMISTLPLLAYHKGMLPKEDAGYVPSPFFFCLVIVEQSCKGGFGEHKFRHGRKNRNPDTLK